MPVVRYRCHSLEGNFDQHLPKAISVHVHEWTNLTFYVLNEHWRRLMNLGIEWRYKNTYYFRETSGL